jgi:hypothetical protein
MKLLIIMKTSFMPTDQRRMLLKVPVNCIQVIMLIYYDRLLSLHCTVIAWCIKQLLSSEIAMDMYHFYAIKSSYVCYFVADYGSVSCSYI